MIDEKQLSEALAKEPRVFDHFCNFIEFACTDERIKFVYKEIAPRRFAKICGKQKPYTNIDEFTHAVLIASLYETLFSSLSNRVYGKADCLREEIHRWCISNLYKVANECREGRKLKDIYKPFYMDFVRFLAESPVLYLRKTEGEE